MYVWIHANTQTERKVLTKYTNANSHLYVCCMHANYTCNSISMHHASCAFEDHFDVLIGTYQIHEKTSCDQTLHNRQINRERTESTIHKHVCTSCSITLRHDEYNYTNPSLHTNVILPTKPNQPTAPRRKPTSQKSIVPNDHKMSQP